MLANSFAHGKITHRLSSLSPLSPAEPQNLVGSQTCWLQVGVLVLRVCVSSPIEQGHVSASFCD